VKVESLPLKFRIVQRVGKVAAARHGWQVVATFEDQGVSGAKGRDKRPGFDRLLKGVARRDFDMVAAWAVDRLGRSLQDLVSFLSELQAKGVDLFLHQQGLDTSTPSGRAMFGMLSVFAEFERSMIVSRVKSGLARAKDQHKKRTGKELKLGRPSGLTPDKDRQAREMLVNGTGVLKIAKTLSVGVGTVHRMKGELTVCKVFAGVA
jgi:DNA invertase Pin-like site-specific DNA recombinase